MNIYRIAGALAFALLVAVLARRRLPAWCVGALFITPVVFLLADENFRIFSYHGLTHYSIVYGLIERGPPPTIPLLAGEPLFYPYGLHYLIAQAMRLIPLAPPWLFAGINIASLVATIAIVDRIARLFSPNRDYRTL